MRTAKVCDTCANYYNAKCIIYDGAYLTNIQVNTLDNLDLILHEINTALPPLSGSGNPTANVRFVGQFYLNTTTPSLWIGLTQGIPNWGLLGSISTTTTTSTTSTTSTTTTVPSDFRLKSNIRWTGRFIGLLKEYIWDWNNVAISLGLNSYSNVGIIAQEGQIMYPEAISIGNDGYLRVDYSKIFG